MANASAILRPLVSMMSRRSSGLRKRSVAECGACGIGCLGLVMGKGGRLILRMERVLDGDGIWISIAFSGIFFTCTQNAHPASRKNSALRVSFLYQWIGLFLVDNGALDFFRSLFVFMEKLFCSALYF